jgi:ankyrin repeat protein
MLLNKGADINAKSLSHQTALQIASDQGHEKIVKMLLNHGARREETTILG